MKKVFLLTCALASITLVPTGCAKTAGTTVTKEEQANFKGGPMPPEVRRQMEASQKQRQQNGGQ